MTAAHAFAMRPARSPGRTALWILAVLALAAVAFLPPDISFLSPVLGLLVTTILPGALLARKIRMPGSSVATRLVIGLAASVLALIVVGLLINTVLPLLGDNRPLAKLPVCIAVVAENVVLVLWRSDRLAGFVPRRPAISGRLWILLGLLAASLLAVVAGANRLNNGASGHVTLIGFCLMVLALLLTWKWRNELSDSQIAAMIYLLTLGLLLATSLRGWFITGHDVQREYHVFQITNAADRWNISAFRDPYNACLSLTVLPTMWARTLGMDPAYVFKVVDQAFFAVSGAAVYLVGRRQFSKTSALLGAVVYISFPTFFTDMPFITRQEVGFTFLAVALLVLTNDSWSPAGRRVMFTLFGVGIVLSHYSTTYLLLIALGASQLFWRSGQFMVWLRARRKTKTGLALRPAWGRPVAGISVFLGIGLVAFLWTVPATHTSSELGSTINNTVQTLLGRAPAAQSTDLGYSLIHSKVQTPQQELSSYRAATLKLRDQDPSLYLSSSDVKAYPVQAVNTPDLAPTAVGRELPKVGVSASGVNTFLRLGLAKYYQIAALLGLALLLLRLRRRAGVSTSTERELLSLAAASLVGIGAVMILPDLSTEYGLLRAFQQALIFLAPAVAEATIWLAQWISRRFAEPISMAVGGIALASLSGAVPQILGGYSAQLSLNNGGVYYNDYYLHPQDESAISWLNSHAKSNADVQAEIQTDRYRAYLVADNKSGTTSDIFPTVIQRKSYIFLGFATVTLDQASVSVDGNTVSYKYPTGLLNQSKSIVFASDGSRIYK